MITKRILRPERLRVVPRSFSWLDHRLLRDGHLERLQPREILLYFFLVLVGDRQGLSYYSPPAISRYLKLSADEIQHARRALGERGLIAFEDPLYQVLALPEREKTNPSARVSARTQSELTAIGPLLKELFEEARKRGH